MASVDTSVGTAISAEPCSVASGSGIPSSVSSRWVFSIVTVESSTRMPTASARPPSVMVLSVSPRKYSTTSEDRIASGIEIMTTSVDRHEPRNSRIISAVSAAAIAPSRSTPATDCFDEHRLIEQLVDLEAGWRGGAGDRKRLAHAVDDVERRRIAVLDDAQQHRAPAVLAHDVLLHRRAVVNLADVLHEHRGAVDDLDRDVVEIVDARGRRVGAHGVLRVADLRRAGRQRQVLRVDGVDDVDRRETLGQQLVGVDIDHDLPVLAAGGRRQRDAVDRRQLLAQIVDAVVVELLLVETCRS